MQGNAALTPLGASVAFTSSLSLHNDSLGNAIASSNFFDYDLRKGPAETAALELLQVAGVDEAEASLALKDALVDQLRGW